MLLCTGLHFYGHEGLIKEKNCSLNNPYFLSGKIQLTQLRVQLKNTVLHRHTPQNLFMVHIYTFSRLPNVKAPCKLPAALLFLRVCLSVLRNVLLSDADSMMQLCVRIWGIFELWCVFTHSCALSQHLITICLCCEAELGLPWELPDGPLCCSTLPVMCCQAVLTGAMREQ